MPDRLASKDLRAFRVCRAVEDHRVQRVPKDHKGSRELLLPLLVLRDQRVPRVPKASREQLLPLPALPVLLVPRVRPVPRDQRVHSVHRWPHWV